MRGKQAGIFLLESLKGLVWGKETVRQGWGGFTLLSAVSLPLPQPLEVLRLLPCSINSSEVEQACLVLWAPEEIGVRKKKKGNIPTQHSFFVYLRVSCKPPRTPLTHPENHFYYIYKAGLDQGLSSG